MHNQDERITYTTTGKDYLLFLFILGIVFRCLIFFPLHYSNPDPHYLIVEYIYNHHKLPLSSELSHSFHPPLYYLLAAPILSLGSFKLVQLLSLVISILTLFVFYSAIKHIPFIRYKTLLFIFPVLLPEFVYVGLIISNDTLTYLLGIGIIYQAWKYLNSVTKKNEYFFSGLIGLGLLTKGTFLSFLPISLILILIANIKAKRSKKQITTALLSAMFIMLALGSFKYVENAIYEGNPFQHNLDYNPAWAEAQKPTYTSFKESVLGFNLLKIIKAPTLLNKSQNEQQIEIADNSILHSYPLMLYASFYYNWIPDSNFLLWQTKGKFIGSVIYILAIIPTLMLVLGLWQYIKAFRVKAITSYTASYIFQSYAILLFIFNGILIVHLGIKYDVWSCFQGRLIYPAMFGFIVLVDQGLQAVSRYQFIFNVTKYSFVLLSISYVCYFSLDLLYTVSQAMSKHGGWQDSFMRFLEIYF